MSSVPSETVSTSRIDRLSNLPDELLDGIFRDAYDEDRPTGPLSKFLLPYYQKNIYRSIELKAPQNFLDFEAILSLNPRLGGLVQNVAFTRPSGLDWRSEGGHLIDESFKHRFSSIPSPFARMFSHLVNLKTLDLSDTPCYLTYVAASILQLKCLDNLRHLTVTLPRKEDHFDLQALEFITDLPLVQSLTITITSYYSRVTIVGFHKMSRQLTQLKTLSLTGRFRNEHGLDNLLLCSTSLSRFTFDSSDSERDILPSLLHLLPSDLRSLEIHSHSNVDSLLPRFQQLTHLRIFGKASSDIIHRSLQQFPDLRLLELQYRSSPNFLVQLESFVSGPSRLPSLEILSTGNYRGREGHRIGVLPKERFDGWGFKYIGLSDWQSPFPHDFDIQGLRRFMQVAVENNVSVGKIEDSIKLMENYFIEANNRSALLAYHEEDFERLKVYRTAARAAGFTLPPLIFESLRRDIRITKTELPNKNWFALSLRNADDPDDDEEEEEEWTGRSSESESETE